MQQIKSLKKIPNDWDDELRKNGISFNLFEPINKLLSFQQEGKEIYPAFQDIYKAFELCSF
jgi:uracil DNA glycosylase